MNVHFEYTLFSKFAINTSMKKQFSDFPPNYVVTTSNHRAIRMFRGHFFRLYTSTRHIKPDADAVVIFADFPHSLYGLVTAQGRKCLQEREKFF